MGNNLSLGKIMNSWGHVPPTKSSGTNKMK